MTYLYAYDISDNRRRTRVSKKLEQFGIRLQKSVFQCDISAEWAEKIKNYLLKIINEKEDNLLIIPLCEKDLEKTGRFGLETSTLCTNETYTIL